MVERREKSPIREIGMQWQESPPGWTPSDRGISIHYSISNPTDTASLQFVAASGRCTAWKQVQAGHQETFFHVSNLIRLNPELSFQFESPSSSGDQQSSQVMEEIQTLQTNAAAAAQKILQITRNGGIPVRFIRQRDGGYAPLRVKGITVNIDGIDDAGQLTSTKGRTAFVIMPSKVDQADTTVPGMPPDDPKDDLWAFPLELIEINNDNLQFVDEDGNRLSGTTEYAVTCTGSDEDNFRPTEDVFVATPDGDRLLHGVLDGKALLVENLQTYRTGLLQSPDNRAMHGMSAPVDMAEILQLNPGLTFKKTLFPKTTTEAPNQQSPSGGGLRQSMKKWLWWLPWMR